MCLFVCCFSGELVVFSLGLFGYEHMSYEAQRAQDLAGEPSIAEMTEKAIRLLRRKNERFFLFVEGLLLLHIYINTNRKITD